MYARKLLRPFSMGLLIAPAGDTSRPPATATAYDIQRTKLWPTTRVCFLWLINISSRVLLFETPPSTCCTPARYTILLHNYINTNWKPIWREKVLVSCVYSVDKCEQAEEYHLSTLQVLVFKWYLMQFSQVFFAIYTTGHSHLISNWHSN